MFQGTHILGALRGRLCNSSAFLSVVFFLLQRVSIACYAERCISYDRFCPTVRPSDRLTVRHTLVSCQNDSSYDHAVFAGG